MSLEGELIDARLANHQLVDHAALLAERDALRGDLAFVSARLAACEERLNAHELSHVVEEPELPPEEPEPEPEPEVEEEPAAPPEPDVAPRPEHFLYRSVRRRDE